MAPFKGSRVTETTVFSRPYCLKYANKSNLKSVTLDITTYRGEKDKPEWTDVEPGQLSRAKLCADERGVHAT